MAAGEALVSCRGIVRTYRRRGVRALCGVTFGIGAGESVAVVGASGSGKSTLVGVLAALDRPQGGEVRFGGRSVWDATERERRAIRRRLAWIPQDALASFDPRHRVGEVVAEALPRGAGAGAVADLLRRVGLDPETARRRPATLSGGERRRVAIARALAVDPEVLLADEPTSGLDVLAQEHLLEVIAEQRGSRTLVVVTHDLRVARRMAERVLVLDGGRLAADVGADALTRPAEAAAPLRRLLEAAPAPG